MNAIARMSDTEALTPQQRRYVEAIVSGKTPEEAVELAGYSETVHWSIVAGSLRVQGAIRAAVEAELNGPMRVQAMLKLKKLLTDDNTPAATALNAAKLVIERGDDADDGNARPMTEMSIAELEAIIERKSGELRDVTPSNGA